MSVIVFPLLCQYCYFGYQFNLSEYALYSSENPYLGVVGEDFTSKVDIDVFTSEYEVVQSSAKLSKFFGMDAVSYLKMNYELWHWYSAPDPFLYQVNPITLDKVIRIGVKLSLKTINETIREGHPTSPEWENRSNHKGTHYLKSIIYGSEVHSIIHFLADNSTHFKQIKRAVNRKIGSKGTFDESIQEKIDKIKRQLGGVHYTSFFPYYGIKIESHGKNYPSLLEIKKNLEGSRSFVSDYSKLLLEFHSLSELFPTYPSVEVSRSFLIKTNQLILIFEDTLIARTKLESLLKEKMTEEDYQRCKDLKEELDVLNEKIRDLVKNLDISTLGNAHQFDEVFWYYNSSNNKKYRKKVHRLMNDISVED